jgi:NADH:ubiquinone oxidoreductase subunit 5 (subunit L)/multisubunit Na+/H+ antiporter MnhA subunit
MAGTIAIVQTDIKRVLAYSTVSQLGFMFLAAGMGAFGVAVFHLYTHAFFKALLVPRLGLGDPRDVGRAGHAPHGRAAHEDPWTFGTFLIGTLAIAGIPGFAGFFSKDEILLSAIHHPSLFGIALFTALLTAAYMSRLLFLTFFGEFRGGTRPSTTCTSRPGRCSAARDPGDRLGGRRLRAVPGQRRRARPAPGGLQPVFRLAEPHSSTWVGCRSPRRSAPCSAS